MTYSGGQTYVGEWEHGVRSGFGKYTLPDGTVYVGHFKRDKKHGAGTLRSRGEDAATAHLWENGELVGAPQPEPSEPAATPPLDGVAKNRDV